MNVISKPYEFHIGDTVSILSGGKVKEATIVDIFLESYINDGSKYDWKCIIKYKYKYNPEDELYVVEQKFSNSFIEAYDKANKQ